MTSTAMSSPLASSARFSTSGTSRSAISSAPRPAAPRQHLAHARLAERALDRPRLEQAVGVEHHRVARRELVRAVVSFGIAAKPSSLPGRPAGSTRPRHARSAAAGGRRRRAPPRAPLGRDRGVHRREQLGASVSSSASLSAPSTRDGPALVGRRGMDRVARERGHGGGVRPLPVTSPIASPLRRRGWGRSRRSRRPPRSPSPAAPVARGELDARDRPAVAAAAGFAGASGDVARLAEQPRVVGGQRHSARRGCSASTRSWRSKRRPECDATNPIAPIVRPRARAAPIISEQRPSSRSSRRCSSSWSRPLEQRVAELRHSSRYAERARLRRALESRSGRSGSAA